MDMRSMRVTSMDLSAPVVEHAHQDYARLLVDDSVGQSLAAVQRSGPAVAADPDAAGQRRDELYRCQNAEGATAEGGRGRHQGTGRHRLVRP